VLNRWLDSSIATSKDTPGLIGISDRLGCRAAALDVLKSWAWLTEQVPDLVRDRSVRGTWATRTAVRTGKAAGSIESHTLYL